MEKNSLLITNLMSCPDRRGEFLPSLTHCSTAGKVWVQLETLYHRDDPLLYIAYVMFIWAVPIPADRWHCSLWP